MGMGAALCIAPEGTQPCAKPREVGALFCKKHMAASPGQRGGWISAEKRRRAMNASQESALDASNVATRLWVGSVPPFDRDLPELDVLVLCAQEIQPPTLGFTRQVVRVPLPDSALTDAQIRRALVGGRAVAEALAGGKRVLVTCAAGLNRSAFVASLGLGLVTKLEPIDIIQLMRQRRDPMALSNKYFCELIMKFVSSKRPVAQ